MTKIATGKYLQSLINSNGAENLEFDSSRCYTYSKITSMKGFSVSTPLQSNRLVKESLIKFENQNTETYNYNLLMPAIYTTLDYSLGVDYEIEEYDTIYSAYSSLTDRLLYTVLDSNDNEVSDLSGIEIGTVIIGDPDNNAIFTTDGNLISFWWGKLPNMQQDDSLLNKSITGDKNEVYSFYVYGPSVNTTSTNTSIETIKNAILNAYDTLGDGEKNLKFVSWENTSPSNMIFNAYLALGTVGPTGAEDYVCFAPIRIYAQCNASVNGSYPITAHFDFDGSQTIQTNLTENEYLLDESNIGICYSLPMGVMSISEWNSN